MNLVGERTNELQHLKKQKHIHTYVYIYVCIIYMFIIYIYIIYLDRNIRLSQAVNK